MSVCKINNVFTDNLISHFPVDIKLQVIFCLLAKEIKWPDALTIGDRKLMELFYIIQSFASYLLDYHRCPKYIYILQRREFSDYGNTPPWLHKYVIRKDQRALPSRNLILTTALKEPTTKLIRVAAVRGCAPLPASIAPDDS